MLSASHWLLAQARFCGRTHLPLSPNSTTSTVQVIFRYLRPDAPVFNIHRIHSTCGHGDILAITLLILSLSGCSCLNILWYTAPVDMMTFRWSHRSYQSICQHHPPYSHPQVTLIYYTISCAHFSFWFIGDFCLYCPLWPKRGISEKTIGHSTSHVKEFSLPCFSRTVWVTEETWSQINLEFNGCPSNSLSFVFFHKFNGLWPNFNAPQLIKNRSHRSILWPLDINELVRFVTY